MAKARVSNAFDDTQILKLVEDTHKHFLAAPKTDRARQLHISIGADFDPSAEYNHDQDTVVKVQVRDLSDEAAKKLTGHNEHFTKIIDKHAEQRSVCKQLDRVAAYCSEKFFGNPFPAPSRKYDLNSDEAMHSREARSQYSALSASTACSRPFSKESCSTQRSISFRLSRPVSSRISLAQKLTAQTPKTDISSTKSSKLSSSAPSSVVTATSRSFTSKP